MNLILLHDDDFDGESQSEKKHVRLTGRRRQHVLQIHRASVGDQLVVGLEGDRVGRGRITRLDDVVLELDVELGEAPPPKLGATLALALPRPPVLARLVSLVKCSANVGIVPGLLLNPTNLECRSTRSRELSHTVKARRVLPEAVNGPPDSTTRM